LHDNIALQIPNYSYTYYEHSTHSFSFAEIEL